MKLRTEDLPDLPRALLLLGRRYQVMAAAIRTSLDHAFDLGEWAEALQQALHTHQKDHPEISWGNWDFDPKTWRRVAWDKFANEMAMSGMAYLMCDEALGKWVPTELGEHAVPTPRFGSDKTPE